MLKINADLSIYLTRGDVAVLETGASNNEQEPYMFKTGDIVRFTVVERGDYESVVFSKDVVVENETPTVDICLTGDETKLGEPINKPKDYWYEIELNPDIAPQTLIGHDNSGPKIFRLFPEGVVVK